VQVSYSESADALYIRLSREMVARTESLDTGTLVDLDTMGRPVGIEVIHPARIWPLEAILDQFSVSGDDAASLRALFPRAEGVVPYAGYTSQLRVVA
jgi:uncharacterized protein YuzE